MKCANCGARMKGVQVAIEGASQKVASFQCPSCDTVEFEAESSKRVIAELKGKESALRMTQKIIKLSKDRLGIYLNRHIVESLGLKPGKEVSISVPDKEHIVLKIYP